MKPVVIYTTAVCPYCDRAKALLTRKNVPFEEIRVDRDDVKKIEMMERSNRRTVPQIFIGDRHVGGSDDLHALESQGELDAWLVDD